MNLMKAKLSVVLLLRPPVAFVVAGVVTLLGGIDRPVCNQEHFC